jgi:hypothetical protein
MDGAGFSPLPREARGRNGQDLTKDIQFDFSGDVARESGGLLSAIGEQKNFPTTVRERTGLFVGGWLRVQLGLHKIGERRFAFS